MDFQLSDEQKMLADAAASFAKKTSPIARARKQREEATEGGLGWEPAVWKQMAELGWLGLFFPESAGGLGLRFFDASLVIEKLGTSLVPEPVIPSVVLAGTAVLRAGSAGQRARVLGPMIEGRTSLALAWSERGSRYEPSAIEARATRRGSGYVLSGEKVFVENGHAADTLIVSAREGSEVALFVVDKRAAGLDVARVRRMDGTIAATVSLRDVAVAAEDRLEGDGAAALDAALDCAAAAACAEGLGVTRTVLDMTSAYLKTRKQFGVAIGSFQVLQHRAVDMFVQVQLLESTSILAAVRADGDDVDERRRAVSIAKARLAIGGRFVTKESIQLHGGIGITEEHDIGLYFKRMQALSALYGDEEHHVRRFAARDAFASSVG